MLKSALCIALVIVTFQPGYCQDIITKKNGKTIPSKVLKVNPGTIEYKSFRNQQGPTYRLDVADISHITYQNGTIDSFAVASTQMNQATEPEHPVNSESQDITLAEQGTRDAVTYYKGYKGARGAALGVSLYASPIYGIIPTLIAVNTKPRNTFQYMPNPDLMIKEEYQKAYNEKAYQIKKRKVWEGYGIATGIYATLIAGIVAIVYSTGH